MEVKKIKLNSYKEFSDAVTSSKDEELKKKIQANKDYIEYMKVHDKEAYKNYLSYSTYLKI